jgi:hypothetical protein
MQTGRSGNRMTTRKMTAEIIKKRVGRIEIISGDDESAHCEEDELYYDFVEFLSRHDTPEPYRTMAKELKKVRDIKFSRWHA